MTFLLAAPAFNGAAGEEWRFQGAVMAFSLSASCSKRPQEGEQLCSVHAIRKAPSTQYKQRLAYDYQGKEIQLFRAS